MSLNIKRIITIIPIRQTANQKIELTFCSVKTLSKIIDTKPEPNCQNAVCHNSVKADRDQVQNIIIYL